MSETLMTRLVQLLHRPVPERFIVRARLHLLDWLGCAVQGYARIGPILSASLPEEAAGPCSVLFLGNRDWLSALQVNAGLGNVAEMDDVHRTSTLHPGPVVIPVAIASTQKSGGTLADCLVAIVRGYEAAIRIGRSLGTEHYAYFHNTATAGTPAAAAAAASVLALDEKQTLWALANACSRTGGLWQMRHESVLTKQWHCIAAAIDGVLAARMAAGGLTGPASILEGEQGLYAAMAPGAHPELLTQDPKAWLIEETSFKPWPACRHAHPAIDATRKLREAHQLDADTVEKVLVSTYADAIKFCDQRNPETELQAKFSLQHAVSLALTDAEMKLDDFLPHTPEFDQLAGLRAKVELVEDPTLTRAYPAHFGARIEVYQQDGQSFRLEVQDAWGDPEIPMSTEAIRHKSHHMMLAGNMTQESAISLQDFVLEAPLSTPLATGILP